MKKIFIINNQYGCLKNLNVQKIYKEYSNEKHLRNFGQNYNI